MLPTSTERPYRMKDLCQLSGLPRQSIHFYIQQGLLPPGDKTGRNMAWYGLEHVERLHVIRKLQHERFLPLRAIRALLDGREAHFSPEQRRLIREVRAELAGTLMASGADTPRGVEADAIGLAHGVSRREVDRMVELGVLGAAESEDGRLLIASDDAWMVENLGKIRAAGLTEDLGFRVDDLLFFVEAVDALFDQEMALLSERVAHLPPARVARMIEQTLPLVHDCLVRYHAARARRFFANAETTEDQS